MIKYILVDLHNLHKPHEDTLNIKLTDRNLSDNIVDLQKQMPQLTIKEYQTSIFRSGNPGDCSKIEQKLLSKFERTSMYQN